MGQPIPVWRTCQQAVLAAERADPSVRPAVYGDDAEDELQRLTGVQVSPGKTLHGRFAFGSAAQLARPSEYALREVSSGLTLRYPGAWRYQLPTFSHAVGELLGRPEVATWPAVLLATPAHVSVNREYNASGIRRWTRLE